MKSALIAVFALALCACASWTPTQKKVAAVVGSVLVVGAIAANSDGGSSAAPLNPPGGLPCTVQPDGSCR